MDFRFRTSVRKVGNRTRVHSPPLGAQLETGSQWREKYVAEGCGWLPKGILPSLGPGLHYSSQCPVQMAEPLPGPPSDCEQSPPTDLDPDSIDCCMRNK